MPRAQAFRTSIEIGRSSVRSTKLRNAYQASDIGCSPVNRPVSMITIREIRSGCSTAHLQADRPAPVVDDDRGVAQVEVGEQRRGELGVAVV